MKIPYLMSVLLLTGTCAFSQQLHNAGFEQWDSLSVVDGHRIYTPSEWTSLNDIMVSEGEEQPVTMTTDAHSGKYALKITSSAYAGEPMGMLISGNTSLESESPEEKFPIAANLAAFTGYYKYTPNGENAFVIMLMLFKNGEMAAQVFFTAEETATSYTKFVCNIPDSLPPVDSGVFVIAASVNENNEGSVLIVDDLKMEYAAVGIHDISGIPRISIYPNPADQMITFENLPAKKLTYTLLNTEGKIIRQGIIENNTLATDELLTGIYFVQLSDENGFSQHLKFLKQ